MMGKPLHDQGARCGGPGHDGSWEPEAGDDPRCVLAIGVDRRSGGDEFGRGPGSDGMGPKGMGPDGVWMSGHAKSAPPTWTTRITFGVANGT